MFLHRGTSFACLSRPASKSRVCALSVLRAWPEVATCLLLAECRASEVVAIDLDFKTETAMCVYVFKSWMEAPILI